MNNGLPGKNINLNTKTDFLYLLIDEHTNGVLCSTKDYDVACATTLCSSRVSLKAVETDKPWIGLDFKSSNFNDTTVNYVATLRTGQRYVSELDATLATAEYTKLREEVALRMRFHDSLVNKYRHIMLGIPESGLFVEYSGTITYELLKCKPADGYYTNAIKAYALQSGCDDATAYDELSMQVDNLSHARMRNLGSYIKFRNKLNQSAADAPLMQAIIVEALNELYKNAIS
jgi:hypothetical protein